MPVDPLTVTPGRAPVQPRPKPKTIPTAPGHGLLAAPGQSPLTTPHEPPHPALKQAGLNMGVQGLNQRVADLTAAHQKAFGSQPTPGLVMDVLRSGLDTPDYGQLFQIPRNQADARAQKALTVHKQANPDDYFVTRPDGVIQPDNPFLRWSAKITAQGDMAPGAAGGGGDFGKRETAATLSKTYPMVTMGALPIPGADALFRAVRELEQPGQVEAQRGITPADELKLGLSPKEAAYNTLTATPGYKARQVVTVAQAKQQLADVSGLTFSDGPVFNADDAAKVANWQKSADYFRKQLKFQADQANQSVAQYVKSWDAKWGKNSPVHNGLIGHFLAAMPQQLWGHGGFWSDLASLPFYLKGTSNNPLNIGLHGLTRSVGLTLDVVGGTVSQAKADAAAANTFAVAMAGLHGHPGTYEDAIKQARAQLQANPSWLRIAMGGFLSADAAKTPHWLRTVDVISNVAGDLILLRKPAFTGERVAAGDLGAALKSDHLVATSSWAFRDLKALGRDGVGRAAFRLDGGQGARALVARSAKLVQSGAMGQEEFTRKVAELYATGETTLPGTARVTWTKPSTGPFAGKSDAQLMARRDAIESKYNRLVDQLGAGEGRPGDYKATTAYQNMYAKKLARKGIVQPTVKQQFRDIAETKFLRFLESHADEPIVKSIVAQLDESAAISKELSLRADAALGFSEVSHGEIVSTTGGEVIIRGPLLSALRTNKLPTPGPLGRSWLQAKGGIRDFLNRYDANAADKRLPGSNAAVNFANTMRTAVAHAAPEGARIGYFQRILPEQVYNFVRKYELTDDATAAKIESQLVRYQGTENVQGIQSVQQAVHKLWQEKQTSKPLPGDQPFRAVLSTETPSIFHFPGQAEPKLDTALDSIGQATREANKALNKAAKLHARIILSGLNPLTGVGGFSLFWKHAVGDGLRAFNAGVSSLLQPGVRKALAEIDRLAVSDVAVERQLGAFMDRVRTGETRWALNRGGYDVRTESFRTGDHFLKTGPGAVVQKRNYLTAAGAYLRRHLTAVELQGYRNGDLAQTILHDREARAAWHSQQARNPDLTLEEHAANIAQEYQSIEAALHAQGLTFDDALNLMRENRGHGADEALGRFINEKRLDFEVRGGQVENAGPFDELTSRWVGNVIMRPNKFWRSSLGRAVLGTHYAALRSAGWEPSTAFQVAADTAEQVTKFHMLDFANRLQVEQDLRWVSYFATKHRLYWKWVLSTFMRHPGYAAAVTDFRQTLDSHGGWALPFKVAGLHWEVPLERLVWVPGREYDETSPLAVGFWGFIRSGGNLDAALKGAQGTQGNVLTRSDTATLLGTKLLKIAAGKAPATYGYATSGLTSGIQDQLKKAINEYQQEFFKTHGSYAPESQVVRTVLLHQMGQEYWRANLPLPVVPQTGATDAEQKLTQQFMAIRDPAARRKFLDDHPGFSDHFGIYDDPKLKLHNDALFRRWNTAIDAYRQARGQLFAAAKRQGEWSTDLEKRRRELSVVLARTRTQLLVDDAQQWGIDTHGLTPNGDTVPYGPWGKVVNKDPQFDPSHFLSAIFPKLAKGEQDNVIGPLQRQMQHELTLLNDQKYVQGSGYTLAEVKTRKSELLQALDVFKNYPSDALGVVRDKYQTRYVNKYWAKYDARFKAIALLPSDQRKTADAEFRAWRDSQDHPVTVDGVQFPSPLRMAWAVMDPQTRKERLSYLSAKPLADVADYELDLLGVKHPANVSLALSAIEKASQEYRAQNNASVSRDQLLQVAKQIDKQAGYQGFYAYYVNTLTQPRVRQFEQTSIYREMPAAVKSKFDQVIGAPALELVRRIKADGNRSYYGGEWRKAMEQQIRPWLAASDNKDLAAYLAPMGPNFLNTLVSGG